MVNHIGKFYDETIIANNINEAKIKIQTLNPMSSIIDAKWVYK